MQEDGITVADSPPRRSSSGRAMLGIALLAFVAGLVLAGWMVWGGKLDRYLPKRANLQEHAQLAGQTDADGASAVSAPATQSSELSALEGRIAMLEDRFSRINAEADAASGNAVRAEGLLIAQAARRMIDRGQPLGYIEGQLQLRFADAQPNAVRTLIAASQDPVTLAQLLAQLDVAAARLAQPPAADDAWTRVKHELSTLFVIRSQPGPSPVAPRRLERARVLLASGNVEDALVEIGRMPGASGAYQWMQAARRYQAAQHALDLIETTAMLEPRRLKDGQGLPVTRESPLAQPVRPIRP